METSTPKLERDLGVVLEVDGAEAAADSLASDQFGPRSSSGHSEDSGLEHSGDEAELAGFTGEAGQQSAVILVVSCCFFSHYCLQSRPAIPDVVCVLVSLLVAMLKRMIG